MFGAFSYVSINGAERRTWNPWVPWVGYGEARKDIEKKGSSVRNQASGTPQFC